MIEVDPSTISCSAPSISTIIKQFLPYKHEPRIISKAEQGTKVTKCSKAPAQPINKDAPVPLP